MIKIERDNLDEIASQYATYLNEIGSKTSNEIYNAFSACLTENYVLAHFSEFKNLEEEFKVTFNLELSEYAKTDNDKKKDTEYGKFISYMEGRYKTIMNKEIEHKGREKITIGNWLAQELQVNTCPYCNRQYTFTINSKKKVRPQFDHFLPKSIYPYFALSFYNLVPCCSICNLIKSDSYDKELLHPYYDGFGDSFFFKTNHKDYILNNKSIEVKFDCLDNCNKEFIEKCKKNIDEFALKDLYDKHNDYIEEIIEKAYSYNDDFYDGLINDFSKVGKSSSEIDRLIFGNYIDLADNEKRPLSKLTRDILNDIGLKD